MKCTGELGTIIRIMLCIALGEILVNCNHKDADTIEGLN